MSFTVTGLGSSNDPVPVAASRDYTIEVPGRGSGTTGGGNLVTTGAGGVSWLILGGGGALAIGLITLGLMPRRTPS